MPDERVSAILKTADVARTIEWYREAGFELRGVHPETGNPTWCELSRDGVVLQFLGGETPWTDPPGFTGTLYFYPRSVEALAKEIEGRIEPDWGPEVREWGSRELGLRDPERVLPDVHRGRLTRSSRGRQAARRPSRHRVGSV